MVRRGGNVEAIKAFKADHMGIVGIPGTNMKRPTQLKISTNTISFKTKSVHLVIVR